MFSDRDPIFMSKFWKSPFKSLKMKLASFLSTIRKQNGQSEIAKQNLEEMIRSFVNFKEKDWEGHIADIEAAYISAVSITMLCSPLTSVMVPIRKYFR